MRTLLIACLIAFAPGASAQVAMGQFEWPAVDARAIPDARLRDVIDDAKLQARRGTENAKTGSQVAGQAERITGLRSAIGRGPQPQTIGDGVVMAAVPYGDDGGAMFGKVTWANGSSLSGVATAGMGIYSPAPESTPIEFRGWVSNVTAPFPLPMTGVFKFKNGEMFTGSYNAGTNASGVYGSADGERQFVGEMDFEAGSYAPVAGQVVDRKGKVLAVVRPH